MIEKILLVQSLWPKVSTFYDFWQYDAPYSTNELWLNDEDFTTVMIVTVSGMLVLGIFLILCLVRFPSYDTIENLLHDKRSFRHEWSPDLSLRSFKLHRYLGTTNRLRHEGRDYLKYPFFIGPTLAPFIFVRPIFQ